MLGFNGPQAEEVARRSSENIQAVTEASTVPARGAQEVSQEVFGFVQKRAAEEHRRGKPDCGRPLGAGLRGGSERPRRATPSSR